MNVLNFRAAYLDRDDFVAVRGHALNSVLYNSSNGSTRYRYRTICRMPDIEHSYAS